MFDSSRLAFLQAPFHPQLQAAATEALHAASSVGPGRRQVLLTPTRLLGLHLRRAMARRYGSCLDLRCLGWTELALELTGRERREAGRGLLTHEAPAWLIRQLAERGGRPPNYFDSLLDVRGFRSALLRSFDELGRAGLASCSDVEKLLVRFGPSMPLKLRHALELYLGYRKSFEATHDDASRLLAQAASVPVGRFGTVFSAETLWIYGFEELGALEARLLAHLSRDEALRLRCFVPRSTPEPQRLIGQLEALGFAAHQAGTLPAELPISLEIRALSTPGEESEADEIARQLLAAADARTAFRDMAVVTRSPRRLELLRSTLERCGVRCAVTSGRSLQSCRSGRALLFFLELLESGLTPETAMTFLSVAPLRWREWAELEGDPVPSAWERAARDAFLGRGFGDWNLKLSRQRRELERRAAQLDREGEPAQRARAAARATTELLAIGKALQAELSRFPERGRWLHFVAATGALLEDAFEPGPEVEALHAALHRLRALDVLGNETLSRAEFRDAIRQMLAETTLPDEVVQEHGGVTLGTAAALHGIDFDLVCVAGLQEGEWPGSMQEDPVLLGPDRLELGSLLGDAHALPSRGVALERDRRLFWAAAGAARRTLVLAYARLDPASGATRLPSTLLLEVAARREGRAFDFGALEQVEWLERVPLRRSELPPQLPLLGLAEFDVLAVAALRTSRAAAPYVHRLGELAKRGLQLDLLRTHKNRFTAFDGRLRSRAARRSLAEHFGNRPYSATQLSTYATCPFRFFLRHALRVEPLDRDDRREPSELEVGRLVHRILESFYRSLERTGCVRLEQLDPDMLRERLMECASRVFDVAEARGQTGAALLWQVRKQRLREDLRRFLRYERARQAGHWEPRGFEQWFGVGEADAPQVERPGASPLALRGCIDRLDQHTEHEGLRVIDYKSGKALQGSGNAPLALQLVVYLFAATGGQAARLRRSEACFLYVTRRGGFTMRRMQGEALVRRRGDFERLLADIAASVERGDFFPQPGPAAARCTHCDYNGVCDARIGEQAERKSGAGQTLRFLELPDFATELHDVPVSLAAIPEAAEGPEA